jgi:hypothetical protein
MVLYCSDINAKTLFGETPLHIAATYGADAFAQALISFDASVDAQDVIGGTPSIQPFGDHTSASPKYSIFNIAEKWG